MPKMKEVAYIYFTLVQNLLLRYTDSRLISIEDVSHLIHILIFDFFFNFLFVVEFQILLEGGIKVSETQHI